MNAAVRKYLIEKVLGMEDEEMLESLYCDYLSSLDAGMSDMRDELASGDFVMLDKTAHTLKGATSTVGDTEMFDAVRRRPTPPAHRRPPPISSRFVPHAERQDCAFPQFLWPCSTFRPCRGFARFLTQRRRGAGINTYGSGVSSWFGV